MTFNNPIYNNDWSDAIAEDRRRDSIAFVNWWKSHHTKSPNPVGGFVYTPHPGFKWPTQHTRKGRY
jgi:hypothetical protein